MRPKPLKPTWLLIKLLQLQKQMRRLKLRLLSSLLKLKFETTSTAELLSVNTAFGGNLTNTVTGDAPEAKLADSTAVEPISAADEIAVEAAEVNSDAAKKGNSDVVVAEDNFDAGDCWR